jgi:hypothetical protein
MQLLTEKALHAFLTLQGWYEAPQTLSEALSQYRPPHAAWTEVVLNDMLQLADRLLLRQQPHAQTPAQAAAAPAVANSGVRQTRSSGVMASTSSSSECLLAGLDAETQATLAVDMLKQLASLMSGWRPGCSVTTLATRYVELCTAMEAGLRLESTAVRDGILPLQSTCSNRCLHRLFGDHISIGSLLPLYLLLGMPGELSRVQGQRQLYSLLSTVQKLSHCHTAGRYGELCRGQQVANRCCWHAARAAVMLLQATPPRATLPAATRAAQQHGQSAPAAVDPQQAEMEGLPSLVIFGRCLLLWAEQLQQLTPEVLLLVSTTDGQQQQQLQQQQQQGLVHVAHNAAHMCIPGFAKNRADATALE